MAKITKEETEASKEILLTVTWGKEVLQPLQFHSIEIGPFQITRKTTKGESVNAAAEWYDEMERWAEEQFQKKVAQFKKRVTRLRGMMKSN
jgi:exopolyphosphatase/pppGpp-phosphohydrolase